MNGRNDRRPESCVTTSIDLWPVARQNTANIFVRGAKDALEWLGSTEERAASVHVELEETAVNMPQGGNRSTFVPPECPVLAEDYCV
jgi:hypothetical protein